MGIYCLRVTAAFANAVATVDDQEGAAPGFASLALAPSGVCADLSGANAEVRTYSSTGTLADRQFFANFN
jgi:hypothetical protein